MPKSSIKKRAKTGNQDISAINALKQTSNSFKRDKFQNAIKEYSILLTTAKYRNTVHYTRQHYHEMAYLYHFYDAQCIPLALSPFIQNTDHNKGEF